MTDQINPTPEDLDDDTLFQGAEDTFANKFDLKDRLVVIYPTGVHGTRQSESNGKEYEWYETTTVVLDDGPNGWQPEVMDFDAQTMRTNLVPSVADNGPQVLAGFQWTPGGLVSRIKSKLPDANGKPGSIVGRINMRPNERKGMAPPWSIAKPTEDDMAIARQYTKECAAARRVIMDAIQKKADNEAF